MTSWELSEDDWATYLSEQKSELISAVKSTFIMGSIVVTLLMAIIFFIRDLELMKLIAKSLMIGIGGGAFLAIVYGIFRLIT